MALRHSDRFVPSYPQRPTRRDNSLSGWYTYVMGRNANKYGGYNSPREPDSGWPDWMYGKIPWTLEGLLDALDFDENLRDKPKDDWDLTPKGLTIDLGAEGGIQRIEMNKFHPMNQIAFYLVQKYHDTPENRAKELGAAHGFRYMQAKEFLINHMNRLLSDGLAQRDGKAVSISHGVLNALAVLPFSETGIENGNPFARYSYDELKTSATEWNTAHPD
jgi:hypothetical protein